MRLRAIELEGFRSFREHERVDLTDLTLTAVIGGNHQGKTSLISHAVEFALYARSPGSLVTDVISHGQSKATVTLEFDLAGATYRITRTRPRKGSQEVYVAVADPDSESGWQALEEKYGKHGADPHILQLLGMNSETARATWLIPQGEFGSFCEMDPAPRREVLTAAFGLDTFDSLAEGADKHLHAVSAKLDKAQYDLASLTARRDAMTEQGPFPDIADEDLAEHIKSAETEADEATAELASLDDPQAESRAKQARQALEAFDANHEQEVRRHQQDKTRIESSLAEATDMARQAKEAKEAAEAAVWQIDEQQQAVAEATEAVKDGEEKDARLREALSGLDAQQASLATERDATTEQASELSERVESLRTSATKGHGECFTCGQSLTEQHAHDLISEQEQHKEQLRQQYRDKDARLREAGEKAQQARTELAEVGRALTAARQRQSSAEQALAAVTAQAESVDLWTGRLKGVTAKVTGLEDELLRLGKPPEPDHARRRELADADSEAQKALSARTEDNDRKEALTAARASARDRMKDLWREQTRREENAAALADLKEPLKKAQESVESLTKDSKGYSVLKDAFRPNGIPAMILAGVIEELNEEANDILGTMGSDLGVLVTTQKETKKGAPQDKVMIYAVTADGPVDYKTLSGQEKVFVALALRMGLAGCVARRTGAPLETIIQDEGWGVLDEGNKRAVQKALEQMSQRFAIFTVTHIEDVKSAFPTVIDVDASSGTSRATVQQR